MYRVFTFFAAIISSLCRIKNGPEFKLYITSTRTANLSMELELIL